MSSVRPYTSAALCAALTSFTSACSTDAPPAPCASPGATLVCGSECSTDLECGSGTHCEAGRCTAECVAGSSAYACAEGQACDADGRCTAHSDAATDAAADASEDAHVPSGDAGSDATAPGCGEVRVAGKPRTPNVLFIVDQSSSMDEDLERRSSRWDVLKDTLLADDGLIADLQDRVRFGAVMYSGAEDNPTCPLLTQQTHALDNLEAIRAMYPENTIADTPTGDAIDAVVDQLAEAGTITQNLLDRDDDPTVFILATDGEPDTCAQLNPQHGQDEAVAAVARAFTYGVRTYVIAVAQESELSDAHLTDLANAGLGVETGAPDAPSYRVHDQAGLRDNLLRIVGEQLSCDVSLEGRVTNPNPCAGTVLLNGQTVECGGADGWHLLDPQTVQLRGTSCETLKRGGTLEAVFDCNSVILI